MPRILVTGCAGFIGFHIAKRLLERGDAVTGLDNLNEYYDVRLKRARLAQLRGEDRFRFVQLDLADRAGMARLFAEEAPETVVHMAAQAGVRYSLIAPQAYSDSNLAGFCHILEGCRQAATRHLVFASSSSVYGANTRMPFSVRDSADHPLSLYAATKKANELLAHAYAHLFRLPCTGLRFFTVYGPWGRPDMALFLFTRAILQGKAIEVFNHGNMSRDFTYIDDAVEAVVRILSVIPRPDPAWDGAAPDPATSSAPYRIYNVGSGQPVELEKLIELLEAALGRKAQQELMPMQNSDVPATCADVADLERAIAFRPRISIEEGVRRFVQWYRSYSGL